MKKYIPGTITLIILIVLLLMGLMNREQIAVWYQNITAFTTSTPTEEVAYFVPTATPELPSAPVTEPTAEPTTPPLFHGTPEPSEAPLVESTAEPSATPSVETTAEPSATPSIETTPEPSSVPTPEPTPVPTPEPTPVPTPEPTPVPTPEPTPVPTPEPTPVPTPEPTPVPTPEPTPVPTPDTNYNTTAANDLLTLINSHRTTPLAADAGLMNTANTRALEITTNFAHTGDYTECLAKGQTSAAETVNAWLNSPVHASIILDEFYVRAGVSCYNYNGTLHWVIVLMW